MKAFADLLASNPLVLLCLLLAVGSAIGALSFKRFSLGPAAVLFLALALSAYDERLKLPRSSAPSASCCSPTRSASPPARRSSPRCARAVARS